MSATKIQWAEHTWNPIAGCSLKSPGCKGCYAMSMASRLEAIESAYQVKHGIPGPHAHYIGLTEKVKGVPVWTGKIGVASDGIFLAPLRRKKPTDYFVNSMSDLFHDDVPDEVIDRIFAVMALCPQHIFKILTKRPERMREYINAKSGWHVGYDGMRRLGHREDRGLNRAIAFAQEGHNLHCDAYENAAKWPLPNVWLGVSVEDQARADERIPQLLATPAAVRFLSCEPLLGPLDFSSLIFREVECPNWNMEGSPPPVDPETGQQECCTACDYTGSVSVAAIDWVIVGGESGPKARPIHPDWARSLRDQCAAAGVAFHFKQWGEWAPEAQAFKDCWKGPVILDFDGRYRAAEDALPSPNSAMMIRLGKKRAGRLLDGVEHNGVPS